MPAKLQFTTRELHYLSLHLVGEACALVAEFDKVLETCKIINEQFPDFDARRVLDLRKKIVAALPDGFCPACGEVHDDETQTHSE